MKIIRLKTKLGFLILSKSKPEIILIIFLHFFYFVYNQRFIIKQKLKCKIHMRVNKSKIQKFPTILRNQVFISICNKERL